METLYITIVGILFVLAISDLIVGVSNDAVNFLNSAIGSKAGSFKTIMIIAALGVILGATFSNGMMEVARKGIFHPDQFFFKEIMFIFLAVMITDVILLDSFNTLGLPTSTTVSIVFELFGAAVAVSLIKLSKITDPAINLGTFINSEKALAIISGILLSVFIAFTIGAIVQWLVRLVFTFNTDRLYKLYGGIYGGIALSAITYFLLIKGMKGATFISPEVYDWVKSHTGLILLYGFVAWTIILQILILFTKINVLKITVLAGTFALAMAFAGNDLVNFIGVPLAGLASFKAFISSGLSDPGVFAMDALTQKVQTPTIYLIGAGLIMVITLWTSKKARSVTQTTLDLSRQGEGSERFTSSKAAQGIVSASIALGNISSKVTPAPAKNWVRSRFDLSTSKKSKHYDTSLSFDLLRASVNLVVAAILISIATSMKLPLSTTYVTFMVAMGTSLSDKAWDRDSAVYRINGVFTVIIGWFITALSAFTVAFIMASIISWGGMTAIMILCTLAIFFVVRTQIVFRKKQIEKSAQEVKTTDDEKLNDICKRNVLEIASELEESLEESLSSLIEEKKKHSRRSLNYIKKLRKRVRSYKNNIHSTLSMIDDEKEESAHFYVLLIENIGEAVDNVYQTCKPINLHLENNHKPLMDEQKSELKELKKVFSNYLTEVVSAQKSSDFNGIDRIGEQNEKILLLLESIRKRLVHRIKNEEISHRNSILIMKMITELKKFSISINNLFKSERSFINTFK